MEVTLLWPPTFLEQWRCWLLGLGPGGMRGFLAPLHHLLYNEACYIMQEWQFHSSTFTSIISALRLHFQCPGSFSKRLPFGILSLLHYFYKYSRENIACVRRAVLNTVPLWLNCRHWIRPVYIGSVRDFGQASKQQGPTEGWPLVRLVLTLIFIEVVLESTEPSLNILWHACHPGDWVSVKAELYKKLEIKATSGKVQLEHQMS